MRSLKWPSSLALLLAFSLGAVASCGGSSFVGTWTHVDHFSAVDGSDHEVVITLTVKNDGTFTLNDPTVNGDGSTTPSYSSGTYTVDGETIEMSAQDGGGSGKLVDGKLVLAFNGLTFTKQ